MKRKMKRKCLRCGWNFDKKSEIFSDQKGDTCCEDCLWEDLEYWEDEFKQNIIDEIRDKFGGSYGDWKKWFFDNHEICDGTHDIEWWVNKDDLTEIKNLFYCPSCVDLMATEEEKEDGGEGKE